MPVKRSSSRKATSRTPKKASTSEISSEVKDLIDVYGLQPHPEGGYFVETYRSDKIVDTENGPRASSTAIKFLVTRGSVSRIHRIESDELWHFYSGGPLVVVELDEEEEGQVRTTILGPDDEQQYTVKAGVWFGSFPAMGTEWSLVGCTVSPGFDFEDFEVRSDEGGLERSDRKTHIPLLFKRRTFCSSFSSSLRYSPSHKLPAHITNNLPTVASLLTVLITARAALQSQKTVPQGEGYD